MGAITTIVGVALQLCVLVFLSGRIYNRLENLERRTTSSEAGIDRLRVEAATLHSIETKVDSMRDEVERVRNRLDKYLDGDRQRPPDSHRGQ
jgi:HAMP domain-containing protein